MSDAVLELACGRCGEWWLRWIVNLEKPFDEQLQMSDADEPFLDPEVNGPNVIRNNSPGGYYPSDGNWYRWTPRDAASLPEGATYSRYEFRCPNGCHTNPQARAHTLDDAAVKTLRYLYDTRTPVFRTTVDKLLHSVP